MVDNWPPQYLWVEIPLPVRVDWGMLTESVRQTHPPVLPLGTESQTKLGIGKHPKYMAGVQCLRSVGVSLNIKMLTSSYAAEY